MNFNTARVTNTIVALVSAIILSFSSISFGFAQDNEAYIRRIASMEADKTGPLNPVGLTFSSESENFYVVEDQSRRPSLAVNSEVIPISALSNRKDSGRIAGIIEDPLNMVFDNRNNRLLAFLPSADQFLEVRENPSGNLDRTTVTRHDAGRFDIQEPRGMALDEANDRLYILDAVGPRIVRIQMGPGRNFTGGRISVIDLASSGLVAPHGIAFDPASGHLYVFDLIDQTLYELSQSGQVVSTRNLVPFGLKSPQSMVFAPSGDQTDDPAQMSLFLADSGVISGRGAGSRAPGSSQLGQEASVSPESSGQILELSLVEPVAAAASTFTSSLVKTTDMAAISPPGPDPSGIAYLPAGNRLMVVDGEVEEIAYNITHFQGANVWELSLGGSVIRTANISPVEPTVVPMSDEPTGVAWNPNNGHYYFSDDTGSTDVYDLNPGLDGLVGTSDDTWTGFSTSSYGGGDAEGITYDTWNNRLFVVDGVNAEVYEYTLTGTLVNQFDVLQYGVVDPEAVEFNPDNGTLFVMSSDSTSPVIIETTTSGVLLQTINISSANARVAAGLAYAPASNDPGAKRFYIVDRGFDNNENGNLIDGKLFEMTVPTSGPTPTPSQTFTQTSTPPSGSSPTNTPTALSPGDSFFVSFALSGTVGGVSFVDDDILHFDGQNWSLWFDGSDVGVGSIDVFAISVLDDDTILMALSNNVTLNGLAIAPQDIVRFDATSLGSVTAGTFSMYLDGSDVGLDTTGAKIDSFSMLPDGRILISTTGDFSVPGVTGEDEDIIVFTPASLGDNTSGVWSMYFDGSDVGLGESSDEDIDALDMVAGNIYLSTNGNFSVNGAAGAGEDIFVCLPTSLGDLTACNFSSTHFFDGSAWGLSGNSIDGFHLAPSDPIATPPVITTSTSTLTPTNTATNVPTSVFTFTPTSTLTPASIFTSTPTKTTTPTPSQTFTPTSTPPSGSSPTNTPTALSPVNSFFASFASNGTVNGVSFADEDILRFDGQNWSLWFDGSDVGVGSSDLFAFSVVDADTILMAFSAAVTVNGLAVAPQDIVRFDATSLGGVTTGTFSMYLDGSDVSLDTTSEKIDALSVLPDGRVLISTTGSPSVTGVSGRDEDILAFTPASLGSNTSGSWAMYFDGSDVGLGESSGEDIDALDVVAGNIYLSTTSGFSVTGAAGAGEDIFVCSPTSLGDLTSCNYASTLFFDGSAWGLSGNSIDGFHLASANPAPSGTPTATPSKTLTPTSTPTKTVTPTGIFSSTPTNTPLPVNSPTSTPTATPAPTSTYTPTGTSITTLVFTPTDDSTLLAASPNANSGTTASLEVDSNALKHFMLKFVVSGVNAQSISKAKLRLYNTDSSPIGGEFYRVSDNNWSETTITWNNAPAPDAEPLAALGSVSSGIWYEIDLTSLITGDGMYTLRVTSSSTNGADYSSKEGGAAPELVITISR